MALGSSWCSVGLLGAMVLSASAEAGFVVSQVRSTLSPTLDRLDLYAFNTGGTTGTRLAGISIDPLFIVGGKSYWSVEDTDEDGIVDSLDIFNLSNRPEFSSFRPNPGITSSVIHGPSPFSGYRQPNSWSRGVHAFSVDGLSVPPSPLANSGNGYRFARLVVDKGANVIAQGKIGGDVGPAVPFSLNVGSTSAAPVVSAPGGSEWAPIVLDLRISSNYEIPVSALDPDGRVLDITMNVPNARFLDNMDFPVEPAASKVLRITGLDASDLGYPAGPFYLWPVDFHALDNSGRIGTKTIYLQLLAPEPTTGITVAAIAACATRRRRAIA